MSLSYDPVADPKSAKRFRVYITTRGVQEPQGGVTQRCRQSCLTNSALVYEPKCGGGGVARSQPMSTAVHMEPNKLW
jgi:hypothetical protein